MDKQNLPFYTNDLLQDATAPLICLRITSHLVYKNILSSDYSHDEKQLGAQLDNIANDLQNVSFFVRSSNVILSPQMKIKNSNRSVSTCGDLFEQCHKCKFDEKLSPVQSLAKFVSVELLKEITVPKSKDNYTPLFTNHKGICRLQTYKIPIDCLVLVSAKQTMDNLYDTLSAKLNSHFEAIKQCYITYYQNENDFLAQNYHFLLDEKRLVTCIYPSNNTDHQLISLRKDLHGLLELPLDRPFLRRTDALSFAAESKGSSSATNGLDIKANLSNCLVNPHLSAKPSNVLDGKQSLVKGNYIYFHYMQNDFNDNGWGCAYRSFQTIYSWFILQSYTNKTRVPTHREIQQTLVDIGDKPKEFIGSSKWIGSMEISFCLSQMLNVDSKILSVSRGSEISDKARELQYHFETEGTPVMIGGGVLAHTIIGVDFNDSTGEVKYLVLDPHYTGQDDIKTITGKGWVGWKDVKFWQENSFYNICCPIRPRSV